VLHNTRAQSVIMNPAQDESLATVRDLFSDLLRLPEANRLVSGMMSGLDVQYPGVGPRMIDLDLTTRNGPTRLSRLMHSGRGLLLSLDGITRSLGGRDDRIDHVAAKSDEPIEAVLIRPDGYIGWSATDRQPLE
jgi:hypothetical protein